MKNLIYVLTILVETFAYSQVKTPKPSPASELNQVVGLTNVSVKFSRPAKRGRDIFGSLIPYDKVWRTGADENTTISFSDNVTIGDKELVAGKYAIYTRPGKTSWEVIFYSDASNWGNPKKWDDEKVAASIKVTPMEVKQVIESFSIWISDLNNKGAILNIGWDTTIVSIPFTVPTIEKATASIMEELQKDPKHGDYYKAAVFYLQEGKDLNKAKEWIAKAVEGNDKAFWYLRQQSLILAKLKDKDGAIAAAKKSMALAEEAGNADYVALNKASLKEWTE